MPRGEDDPAFITTIRFAAGRRQRYDGIALKGRLAGESTPAERGTTPEGQQQSRRIEPVKR